MTFVIAIDGPAGTGKSSVAKSLAAELKFIYVDTGAIYRALAYLVFKTKIDPEDAVATKQLISRISIKIDEENLCTQVAVDDVVLEREIRTEEISRLSSIVSKHQNVRTALLKLQRDLIFEMPNGAIFEGRDIGTVVFPHAPLKIFITADTQTRARRRHEELLKNGQDISFEEVYEAIKNRDERDEKREVAPTQKAPSAYEIDSSHMDKFQVIAIVKDLYERKKSFKEAKPLW